jgi:hypothetical protein
MTPNFSAITVRKAKDVFDIKNMEPGLRGYSYM